MPVLDTLLETHLVPDTIVRMGIRRLLKQKLNDEAQLVNKAFNGDYTERTRVFADELRQMPIAICTEDANEQHYEVPAEFYEYVLGPYKKYSSGFWQHPNDTLETAEKAMLDLYCERAQLVDGQTILDCGCGWGSVSLYLAKKYPNSQITGLSNSHSQRQWIMNQAKQRGLTNLTIVTGNIVDYEFEESRFHRVISIEMFEHMKNYERLLAKLSRWMTDNAKLFIHIFTHKDVPYHYEDNNGTDWLARYFFTGGTMPSHHLMRAFNNHLHVVEDWTVNGTHYEKTANAWLNQLDAHRPEVMPILEATYGQDDAMKWLAYWRIFFMACAELWGYNNGTEWQVSHYLFEKVQ